MSEACPTNEAAPAADPPAPQPATAPTAAAPAAGGEAGSGETPVVYSAVKDVGVAADRNARHRRYMEDAHWVEDKFNGVETSAFFGVYDGHGGKTAAVFCQENLHKVLAEELNKAEGKDCSEEEMQAIFKGTFAKTDELMKPKIPSAGACVVVCLLRVNKEGKKVLYCANAGDARAMLCRDGQPVTLTLDHKASNEAEATRITDSGGFVRNDRVNGMVAITRSLGDHCMKTFIISEPHFTVTELQPTDTHLILACDGVWDVITEAAACELVQKETNATRAAKRLLISAIKGGSTDNITVMVVQL